MRRLRAYILIGALFGVALALFLVLSAQSASAHAGIDDGAHHNLTGQTAEECAGDGRCSHGPDPAPPGVDPSVPVPPDDFSGSSFAICDGNGTSGKRIQVLYVRATDMPERFSTYENSFRGWAAEGDFIYQASAKKTGGTRYLRFVHDSDCRVVVQNVSVTPAGDSNFWTLTAELKAMGFNDPNRKYLVFLDSNHPTFCGQADVFQDDSPGSGNLNNIRTGFAVIYNGCWNSQVTIAHEIGHNLGAVQRTSPNASRWDHCTDEWDVMCYDDGSGSGYELTFPCADEGNDELLDCNNDDYFNTDPPDDSWLAKHWNIANSSWLGAHNATMDFSVDQGVYNTRVEVNLRGFTPNQVVMIRWSDLTEMVRVTADATGTATTSFKIPLVPYETYILQARDTSNVSATDKLKVNSRITLMTTSGYPGSQTLVYLYGFGANDTVELLWSRFDGSDAEVIATVQTAANGRGTTMLTIPFSVEVGTHEIRAQSTSNHRRWAVAPFHLTQTPWTIVLSSPSGKYNSTIGSTLSGFAPSSTVTLRWTDQSVLGSTQTDASGAGFATFKVPLAPLGNYLVIATDGTGQTGVAQLRVVPRAVVNVARAYPGDLIRVTYYGFAPGDQVETRWYPDGGANYVVLNSLTIAENGRGSAQVQVPWSAGAGQHTIRAAATNASRSTSVTLVVEAPTWTVSLDKDKSKYNGVVRFTLAGFAPGVAVSLSWPDGTELNTVMTDGTGSAIGTFRTPLSPLGDYIIRAQVAGGQTASTPLRVIPRVMLNENEGEAGDRIRVYCYGFAPGDQVEVRFQSADDEFVILGTLTIAENGRGSLLVDIPIDAPPGRHTMTGKVVGISRSATATFTVTELGESGDPSPTAGPTETAIPTPSPTIERSPTPEPTVDQPTEEPTLEPPTETPTPEFPTGTPVPIESPIPDESPSARIPEWTVYL